MDVSVHINWILYFKNRILNITRCISRKRAISTSRFYRRLKAKEHLPIMWLGLRSFFRSELTAMATVYDLNGSGIELALQKRAKLSLSQLSFWWFFIQNMASNTFPTGFTLCEYASNQTK